MSPRFYRAWQVDEPPPGFADRVLAHAVGAEKRRVTRRAAFGLAAAACTAFSAWKLDRALHPYVGELTAKVRTEVELAPGAIAVLERGARLLWDRAGARQERGDVSYRVSPTATLQIETPMGSLRGVGSCCRVKLAELAGQTAALLVSVAQGDLDVTHAAAHAALHAGQYVRVTSHSIETETDDTSGEIARELDLPLRPRAPVIVAEKHDEVSAPSPVPTPSGVPQGMRRAPERSPRGPAGSTNSVSAPQPSVSAGARPVIVPKCFCDRGDSTCACFH